jgi:hypothetical protein
VIGAKERLKMVRHSIKSIVRDSQQKVSMAQLNRFLIFALIALGNSIFLLKCRQRKIQNRQICTYTYEKTARLKEEARVMHAIEAIKKLGLPSKNNS